MLILNLFLIALLVGEKFVNIDLDPYIFYSIFIVYLICSIILMIKFKGKLKVFGLLLMVYSISCISINILGHLYSWNSYLNNFNYELCAWGIDSLFAFAFLWFLTRKPETEKKHIQ